MREITNSYNKNDPITKNVGLELSQLQKDYQLHFKTSNTQAFTFQSNNALLQVTNGMVMIKAVANGDTQSLVNQLEKLGLQEASSFGSVVNGWLPVEKIDEMAKLSSLNFAGPSYQGITNVGLVTSQAVDSMNVNIARNNFGANGNGITVGVLSDSYNNTNIALPTNAADDIASGDLPGIDNPFGNNTPVRVLSDVKSGKDEGRGMLQLIHDVAPKAQLAFHTAFVSEANFAQGIIELRNAGSDVIVDDVIYFAEPMFQDGIIAQAVDQVVADGAAYFSSAGNAGRQSYESAFRNSGINLKIDGQSLGMMHDFNPNGGVDIFQSITIEPFSSITLDFQWDSPYASAGGLGCDNDLDIFLLNNKRTKILAFSANNNLDGDPIEMLSYENASLNTRFNIAIAKYDGSDPGLIKYINFGDMTPKEYDTKSGTIFGHANAAGAEAIGAAFYENTPAYGKNPAVIQSYSSAGNTPILFNTDGTRKTTPEIRQKPEIVAPDGINTTFFSDKDPESDGFPNFFGTSAAAPHAAAVAALLLDMKGKLTPNEIYDILESTAKDIDDPATEGFDIGFDTGTGYGLIDANAAIASLKIKTVPSVTINNVKITEGNSGNTNVNFRVKLSAASSKTVTVKYNTVDGTATNPSDYKGIALTSLTFNPGETTKTVSVVVKGDNAFEANETLFMNLSNAINAHIADNQAIASIINDDVAVKPNITIDNVKLTEGNNGYRQFNFKVKLSMASSQKVTVKYATANDTASNANDYQRISRSTLTFNPGETSKIVSVAVKGDKLVEPNETFLVNLTNPTNAHITDSQGIGTISNDDVVQSKTKKIDSLTGTQVGDTFVLGNTLDYFYDQQALKDYAKINKFEATEDIIQLHGSAGDYLLKATPQGTNILAKNTGDLMGLVVGVSNLSLDAGYFSFV